MSEIREKRWSMALGIRAGKALIIAENALGKIGATGVQSDWNAIADLREARRELNHLARRISHIVQELERELP